MSEALNEIAEHIREALPRQILGLVLSYGELNLTVAPSDIVETMRVLRDHPSLQFWNFIDVCGVDYPARVRRFDVVYHLMSPRQNVRLRVKLQADETTQVPSITSIYPGADWFEREAYDLYGILFSGHPELRRILTDYGFEGHPLRKDFPLTGFVEVRYDAELGRVVQEPVKLTQDFRSFPRRKEIELAEFLVEPNRLVHHPLLLVVVADFDEAGEREILAQRMALETVVGEDSAHVGMTDEEHAVEIVGLALEPVGAREDFDQ